MRVERLTPLEALKEAVRTVAAQRDEVYRHLELVTILLEETANQIDHWFPDDTEPEVQNDLRGVAFDLREKYVFRTLEELIEDSAQKQQEEDGA